MNQLSHSNKREYLVKNIEVVDIETSTVCNRKCGYCPNVDYENASLKNNTLMSEDMFTKIVKDLGRENYSGEICLQRYNEPLMDKRICMLISIAKKFAPNSTVAIYSNGDFLNMNLYQELLNAGLDKLTVTQHGKQPSKGLSEVLEYKKNSSDSLIFKFKKLDNFGKFYNRGGEVSLSKEQEKNFFCKASNAMSINSKGDITLCCNDYHSKHVFGNVGKNNILDVFLGEDLTNLRIEAITGNFSREICQLCMYGESVINFGTQK